MQFKYLKLSRYSNNQQQRSTGSARVVLQQELASVQAAIGNASVFA
jgi:hypothetical protein